MNAVSFTGNLTADPELFKTKTGKDICKLRVGIGNGKQQYPVYTDVKVLGGSAKLCAKFLSKGRGVAVTGWLEHVAWKTAKGERRSKLYVATNSIDFLNGRGEIVVDVAGNGASTNGATSNEDDVLVADKDDAFADEAA